jgi:hypothetical protein
MRKWKKYLKGLGLSFLIAENRFLMFADREDRLILFIAFSLIFMQVIRVYDEKQTYKRACERQAERMAANAKKAITRSVSSGNREYLEYPDMRETL